MRKLSAHYIIPISSKPLKYGILVIENNGTVIDLIDTNGKLNESEGIEFYNGIITPGFINTHCHLELSYLFNKIRKQIGLPEFIKYVKTHPLPNNEIVSNSIIEADREMQQNGIVAVADICNTFNSFDIKKNSPIHYINFFEIIGKSKQQASAIFNNALQKIKEHNSNFYITPHASYSVSDELFQLIKNYAEKNNTIISLHNQECIAENELSKTCSGKLYTLLIEMGVNANDLWATNITSLQHVINFLPQNNNILLVHNIVTSYDDIMQASQKLKNIFWVMCPNSNLYINNSLPNIELFAKMQQTITIGTDSLASNTSLSILNELITLQEYFPALSLYELITYATLNGARALQIQNKFGSFEKGKTPGINLIENINFETMSFTQQSKIKVL